ncbi:MAG TPA: WD40 repeat domain-containing protein [Candidatus Dojkabacteria bacterium]|nr:WD40 repeat domain-containing protein [Candidatus Dojkabacteria bacterium]
MQTVHQKPIYKVVFLDDGQRIVTCSDDYTIMVYDLKTGQPLHTLTGHSDRIWNLIKLENGLLASCSSDTTIRVWNIEKLAYERVFFGHTGLVCCLLEFPNSVLASGSQDKSLMFWDLKSESKNNFKVIKNNSLGRIMTCIVINKEELACGSETHIQIINFEDGLLKKTLIGHTALVRDLNLLNDGKTLLSGSDDKSIRMWDLHEAKCLRVFTEHTHRANKILLWNPDIIVSASDDHTIKFWNLEHGNCVKTLTGHTGWVIYITILADGSLLSCGADRTIKIWDVNMA